MKCYLTGVEITENNQSLEHVLPNALGGQLKSRAVLCSEANKKLSILIDTPFNKIFEATYRRLPLVTDRPTKRGIVGKHLTYQEEIIFKDDRCFPRKPIFDPEKNILYAESHKIGEGYIKRLKKEGTIPTHQEVKIWTDMSGGMIFDFSVNNAIYPLGFAKIAAGFATMKGIERTNLKSIIDLDKKEFRSEILLIPFLPLTSREAGFEDIADESVHFPIHSISLRGVKEDSILYCYIELFSTFQCIVILDNDYDGENVYHNYYYDLLNAEEISYDRYFNSVIHDRTSQSSLSDYRYFSLHDLMQMAMICATRKERINTYCHKKFYKLESVITYLTLKKKLEILEKSNIIME